MASDSERITAVLTGIDSWSAPHRAAAVFDRTGILASHGDTGVRVPVASLTKLASAWAVLVAVEELAVALEDPAGPPGSTVVHLLCHASGLPFEGSDPITGPGQRRIYSNSGYEALAAHLERQSGIRFDDYLNGSIIEPLGMVDTVLSGGPASGLISNVDDLVGLGTEMLSPELIDRSTWQLATSAIMPNLSGVLPGWGQQNPCPWGLGPEIKGTKSPHWTGTEAPPGTFGHFGASGSFLWIDPDLGVGCVVVTDRTFDQWAVEAWPRFSDEVRRAINGTALPEQPDQPT